MSESQQQEQKEKQKRIKVACARCHRRKIRCSGNWPCAGCIKKGCDCIFDDPSAVIRNRRASLASTTEETSGDSLARKRSHEEAGFPQADLHLMMPRYQPPVLPTQYQMLSPQHYSSPPFSLPPLSAGPPILGPYSATTQQPPSAGPSSMPYSIFPPPPLSASPQSQSRPSASKEYNSRKTSKQPYFRWLGPTAIAPPASGAPFRELFVNVDEKENRHSSSALRSTQDPTAPVNRESSDNEKSDPSAMPSFDSSLEPSRATSPNHDSSGPKVPPEETIDVFYDHFSSFLPFLDRKAFDSRNSQGTISHVLLNAMGAMAEKVRPTSGEPHLAEYYADRAKVLLLPQLALPTVEHVYAMLLLAYVEFSFNRDSGLWMFCGMALRMAVDLGLHLPFDQPASPSSSSTGDLRSRVFWSCFCLDRFISSGTGRHTTFPTAQIQVGMPVRTFTTPNNVELPDPFPALCRLLIIVGEVTDRLNVHLQNQSPPQVLKEALLPFQQTITEFQISLDSRLHFNVHNFQAYASVNASQVFLLLWLWYQAVFLSVHHSALLYPQGDFLVPNDPVSLELSRSSAISIADSIAFADLIAPESFLSSPFASQPLLMAGRAALSQLRSASHANSALVNNAALERSVSLASNALQRMTQVWQGCSWLCVALTSLLENRGDVDLSREGDHSAAGSIKVRDRGALKFARLSEDVMRTIEHLAISTSSNFGFGDGGGGDDASPTSSVNTQTGQHPSRARHQAGALGLSISGWSHQPDNQAISVFNPATPNAEALSWPLSSYVDVDQGHTPASGHSSEYDVGDMFKHIFEEGNSAADAMPWVLPSFNQHHHHSSNGQPQQASQSGFDLTRNGSHNDSTTTLSPPSATSSGPSVALPSPGIPTSSGHMFASTPALSMMGNMGHVMMDSHSHSHHSHQ